MLPESGGDPIQAARAVGGMIPAEASTVNSLLEKPLSQLTEDDIGQITREECRRFLKERGMRRPSWNKSQAIQQVISLKALLESSTGPDNLTPAIRIHQKSRNPTSPPLLSPPPSSLPSPTEASGSGDSRSTRTPAKDPSPYRRKHSIPPGFTVGDAPRVLPSAFRPQLPSDCHHPPPRTVADDPTAQLTIFYGGMVNVYEGIPSYKAREIFQLAATQDRSDAPTAAPIPSGLTFLHRFPPSVGGPVDYGPAAESVHRHLDAHAGKLQRSLTDSLDEGRALREPLPEGPTSRKASLKRYLEKRKDRYKGRRIIEGSSTSNIELLYLSQKLSVHLQSEHSSRSNSSSAMFKPSCLPTSRCTSFERKNLGIYVDLNDDGSGGN